MYASSRNPFWPSPVPGYDVTGRLLSSVLAVGFRTPPLSYCGSSVCNFERSMTSSFEVGHNVGATRAALERDHAASMPMVLYVTAVFVCRAFNFAKGTVQSMICWRVEEAAFAC